MARSMSAQKCQGSAKEEELRGALAASCTIDPEEDAGVVAVSGPAHGGGARLAGRGPLLVECRPEHAAHPERAPASSPSGRHTRPAPPEQHQQRARMQDAAAAEGASTRPRRSKARASDREGMPRGACDAEDDEDAWLRDDDEATTRPGPSCDVSRDDGASAAVHPAPALLHRPGLDVTGDRRQRRMRCAEELPALGPASSSSAESGGGAGHEVGGVAAAGRRAMPSGLMKPLVVLAFPGMYLVYKITEFKRQQQEHNRRKVTERELAHLNHKIVSGRRAFSGCQLSARCSPDGQEQRFERGDLAASTIRIAL